MELIIGGMAQGKRSYVKAQHPEITNEEIFDGGRLSRENYQSSLKQPVIDRFHLLIRFLLTEGMNVESFIEELILKNPSVIIICDEVGLGIVPMEAFEREYRETVGRVLILLAKRATRVSRMICGMEQRIK